MEEVASGRRLSRTGKESCSTCAIPGHCTTKAEKQWKLRGLRFSKVFTRPVRPNKPSVAVPNPVFVPSLLGGSFLTCGI